jgi:fumarylacetoacetase
MHTPDETHDPALRSWVESANGHANFPIQNLPFGVFERDGRRSGGVAIGDQIVDLSAVTVGGVLSSLAADAARLGSGPVLNPLLAAGRAPARELRQQLSVALAVDAPEQVREQLRAALVPQADVTLVRPVAIGAFTDFLSSYDHTRRMGNGTMPPAFAHLPIAYNSRATSVVVSGTAIRRPNGQIALDGTPAFQPEPMLDFELELGAFVAAGNAFGEPVDIAAANDMLFGYCLVNDWSARAIQFFEMQPLGPFLSKSFATTISPWIVTVDALAPFRAPLRRPDAIAGPPSHLSDADDLANGALEVRLEAAIRTGHGETVVTRTHARYNVWTFGQMLAHHTSNGCNLMPGDLLASGTISGPADENRACLAELTERGTVPIRIAGDEERTFLNDGDEVVFRAHAERDGYVTIGFGECRGTVLPALT